MNINHIRQTEAFKRALQKRKTAAALLSPAAQEPAAVPPAGMPADPSAAAGGAVPVDPAAMGAPPMPPAAPAMDPSMGVPGGDPTQDPAFLDFIQSMGGQIVQDPATGAVVIRNPDGVPIPPEDVEVMYQEFLAGMQQAPAPGMPAQPSAPPAMMEGVDGGMPLPQEEVPMPLDAETVYAMVEEVVGTALGKLEKKLSGRLDEILEALSEKASSSGNTMEDAQALQANDIMAELDRDNKLAEAAAEDAEVLEDLEKEESLGESNNILKLLQGA